MKMLGAFEIVGADIRFAIRGLLKNPGFLAVVVLSLALGIAANSTIYSILDTLLYRPLPYPQPEKLVVIWQTEQAHPDRRNAPPIAQQVDWNKQNHVFEDIALTSFNDTASVSTPPWRWDWLRSRCWLVTFRPVGRCASILSSPCATNKSCRLRRHNEP